MEEKAKNELLEKIRMDEKVFMKASPELREDEGFVLRAFAQNSKVLPLTKKVYQDKILSTSKEVFSSEIFDLEDEIARINGEPGKYIMDDVYEEYYKITSDIAKGKGHNTVKDLETINRYLKNQLRDTIIEARAENKRKWIDEDKDKIQELEEKIKMADEGKVEFDLKLKRKIIYNIEWDIETRIEDLEEELMVNAGIDEKGKYWEEEYWTKGTIDEWHNEIDKNKKLLEEIQKCEIIEDITQTKEYTPEEIVEGINPREGTITEIENEMVKAMEHEIEKEDNNKTIDE